jgi:cysteinyl-tRNA synthetase
MPAYGRLSGRNRDDQIAGARVEVAPYKRDPADFILWKPSAPDQPGWDSPWGRGRPGWHLECSAMAERWLGVPFDIHGGGLDLVFPHHENEIAQTCCAHGIESMARYWLHNGHVDMSGVKMSKSLGNVLRLDEALNIVGGIYYGEAIRFWMLSAQYGKPLDYNPDALKKARRILDQFYVALQSAGNYQGSNQPDPDLVEALKNNLNTPKALAILFGLKDSLTSCISDSQQKTSIAFNTARLKASAALLGLLQQDPKEWLHGGRMRAESTVIEVTASPVVLIEIYSDENIEHLVKKRENARKKKKFTEADEIRDQLVNQGIILEDRPDGTTDWRRAS